MTRRKRIKATMNGEKYHQTSHISVADTMYLIRRSIRFCAILIYCVAGIQAQIADDARDSTSLEDAFPFEDAHQIEDANPFGDAFPIEDSIEGAQYTAATLDSILGRRKIVGGVDDNRRETRAVCPLSRARPRRPPYLSSPLECARTCRNREKPKICYYRFEVEYYTTLNRACRSCSTNSTNTFCNNCQCVPADGVERPILTVNRMIPGPSIDVCEGDKIVVDVINHLEGEGLAIHWHGLFQRETPHYDGAAFVTQCPIPGQTTFRYQFKASNAGTHFWHAHTGLQKMDGIFGRLTIRQSPKRDVNSRLYDFDLSRHGMIINDWMHELATTRLPGYLRFTRFQDPDSILINGKGRYQDPGSGIRTDTDLEVFHVRRNYRYRFRFVNAFCTQCASILTVEGHDLIVIAVDGISIKPVVVNSIISMSGERYDFVIKTNNKVGSYWIQIRAVATCRGRAIQQMAILQYKGASDVPASPPPTFISPLPEGIILNPLDSPSSDAIYITDLRSAVKVDEGILAKKVDVKIYLPFKFLSYRDLFAPNNFQRFVVVRGFAHVAATVDNISLLLPPSPLLTQSKDIPSDTICDSTHKPDDCGNECTCTHIKEIPHNAVVELIIVDETGINGLRHPFHLHGYAFNIMGAGVPNNGTGVTVDEIKRLDEKGLLSRKRISPPFKDTISVPNNGYAILRFRANNPGYWLLHCHIIYHQVVGMGIIFHVGRQSDLPPIPRDFPKCGNYLPPITRKYTSD